MTKLREEHGSAGVGLAMGATALVIVMMFAAGALRVTTTRGDVSAAARAGARAASNSYNQPSGEAAAGEVVKAILADRGVACPSPQVAADGDWTPGGFINVTVTCTVDLSDVLLAGFSGQETIERTATERVDLLRGEES